MKKPFSFSFSNGETAHAVQVDDFVNLSAALHDLGFQGSRPLLVLVGGASKVSEVDIARLRLLFVEVVAPLAEELNACVVDGGTDAGVMKMMGEARSEINAKFSLIGVAPLETVTLPNASSTLPNAETLEPHHTHFVLVPGSNWGDESPWLARVASLLANEAPSVTLLINGGEIALVDVMENLKVGRPVVVIAGSGRLADEIAFVTNHPESEARKKVAEVVQQSNLLLFDLSEPMSELLKLLRQQLTGN
jgi:SLOG in TRPM, prokaryote